MFACCLETSGSCSVVFVSGGFSKALEVNLKWIIEEGREPLQEEVQYKQLDGENTHSAVAKFVLAETESHFPSRLVPQYDHFLLLFHHCSYQLLYNIFIFALCLHLSSYHVQLHVSEVAQGAWVAAAPAAAPPLALVGMSHHLVLLSLWLLISFICPSPLPFGVNHAVICVWWVGFLFSSFFFFSIYLSLFCLSLREPKQFRDSRAGAHT